MVCNLLHFLRSYIERSIYLRACLCSLGIWLKEGLLAPLKQHISIIIASPIEKEACLGECVHANG